MFRTLLVLLGLTAGILAEDVYEIRLHRPAKADDRYKVAAKVAIDSETTTSYSNADDDKETIRAACKMSGELTVVAVTPKGLPKDLRFKITEVEVPLEGARADFFKRGDVIRVRYQEPDNVVEVNDDEPDEVQSEVIDTLFSVHSDATLTDDEVFGTKEKRKLGDEWSIDADAAAKDWEISGFKGIKAEEMKGKTKLAEMTTLGGQPAMKLRGEMTIRNSGMQMRNYPEDFKTKRFHFEMTDEVQLPLDVAAGDSRISGEVKIESESSGRIEQDGEFIQVTVKSKQRYALEIAETPLK